MSEGQDTCHLARVVQSLGPAGKHLGYSCATLLPCVHNGLSSRSAAQLVSQVSGA
jgi:hypothetical protein